MSEVERQMTFLSGQCHSHDQKLRELTVLIQELQAQVHQMDAGSEGVLPLVKRVVEQRLKEVRADAPSGSAVMPRSSFPLAGRRTGGALP